MWRKGSSLLLLASAIVGLAAGAESGIALATEPTAVGPVSKGELDSLWEEGRSSFDSGDFRDAAFRFERIAARYPGSKGYLEAHFLLGKSRIALNQGSRAIQPLRYYVAGSKNPVDAAEGRLWLGKAYLLSRKFHEAYLTSVEVEKGSFPDHPELLPRSLFIKADALMGLKQDSKALEASSAASIAARKLGKPELSGEALRVEIDLKSRECAKLPSPGRLAEDQVRDQIERRGSCVLEALNLYRSLLKTDHAPSSREGTDRMREMLENYTKSCAHPPEPPSIRSPQKPKGRTAEELKRYRAELADALMKSCRSKLASARESLESWKPEMPQSSSLLLQSTLERIRELSQGT